MYPLEPTGPAGGYGKVAVRAWTKRRMQFTSARARANPRLKVNKRLSHDFIEFIKLLGRYEKYFNYKCRQKPLEYRLQY